MKAVDERVRQYAVLQVMDGTSCDLTKQDSGILNGYREPMYR